MRTILLVCSAGMSTSLLVTKMEQAAKDEGVECKIFALPFSDAPRVLEEVDCILLGPQVRFQKAEIEKLAAGRKAGPIPVDVIDMRDYGTMNGEKVFHTALKLLGDE
ncbi:MAG: PTS sugar transporter subunit IIB [Erysipelotrichaceae bacterium]|nr:PTS sugar transporter subunit IIB [Erysipelotrichaceae bacterium]